MTMHPVIKFTKRSFYLMKSSKILQILIPTIVIAFLLFYTFALKRENDKLLRKYMEKETLLEKTKQELRESKNNTRK
jgi:hypothetical protein